MIKLTHTKLHARSAGVAVRIFSPPSPFVGSALMIAGGTKSPVLKDHSSPTVGFWLVPAPEQIY